MDAQGHVLRWSWVPMYFIGWGGILVGEKPDTSEGGGCVSNLRKRMRAEPWFFGGADFVERGGGEIKQK